MKDRAFAEAAEALRAGRDRRHLSRGQADRDGRAQSRSGPASSRCIETTPVPVVPMALSGLWGSFFSRSANGKAMRRWRGIHLADRVRRRAAGGAGEASRSTDCRPPCLHCAVRANRSMGVEGASMAALIGLFAGAFLGNLVWPDWGAALRRHRRLFRRGEILRVAPCTSGGWPSGGRSLVTDAARPHSVTPRRLGRRLPLPASPRGRQCDACATRRGARTEGGKARARGRAVRRRFARANEEEPIGVPETTGAVAVPVAHAAQGFSAPPSTPRCHWIQSPAAAQPAMRAASTASAAHTTTAPVLPPSPANALWAWLTGGNALTRIGVVIVFFGVAFLLKYFAEHFTVPLELRLAAVAAFGIALMVVGLSFARSRPGYGLSLQGAGAGILYLTIYAAFRPYDVLAGDARHRAARRGVGAHRRTRRAQRLADRSRARRSPADFLAPVLVGGSGGPSRCSATFAVLNAAVFALAWAKSCARSTSWASSSRSCSAWRGATSSTARALRDRAAVSRPLLRFLRRDPDTESAARSSPPGDRVDGLLVFGVPLVGFALQATLVQQWRYGAAWSALLLAMIYALLFLLLRKRGEPKFALLCGAFLSLAVIFATIAIPFALDNRYTAALWAVEAAGRLLDRSAAEWPLRAVLRTSRPGRRGHCLRDLRRRRRRRSAVRQRVFRGRDADRRFGARDRAGGRIVPARASRPANARSSPRFLLGRRLGGSRPVP